MKRISISYASKYLFTTELLLSMKMLGCAIIHGVSKVMDPSTGCLKSTY